MLSDLCMWSAICWIPRQVDCNDYKFRMSCVVIVNQKILFLILLEHIFLVFSDVDKQILIVLRIKWSFIFRVVKRFDAVKHLFGRFSVYGRVSLQSSQQNLPLTSTFAVAALYVPRGHCKLCKYVHRDHPKPRTCFGNLSYSMKATSMSK